jgi:ABC-type Na+ transport system ATPase subunit NatA
VEKVCDRVLIIHRGDLIANGTPDELMASTGRSTLEEAFRHLTMAESLEPGVARIIEGLRS